MAQRLGDDRARPRARVGPRAAGARARRRRDATRGRARRVAGGRARARPRRVARARCCARSGRTPRTRRGSTATWPTACASWPTSCDELAAAQLDRDAATLRELRALRAPARRARARRATGRRRPAASTSRASTTSPRRSTRCVAAHRRSTAGARGPPSRARRARGARTRRRPTSRGRTEYNERHREFVARALDDPALLDALPRAASRCPPGYGVGFDERVVEFPWIAAQRARRPRARRRLDAQPPARADRGCARAWTTCTSSRSRPRSRRSRTSASPTCTPTCASCRSRDAHLRPRRSRSRRSSTSAWTTRYYGDDAPRAARSAARASLAAMRELRRVLRPGGDAATSPCRSAPGERFDWVRSFDARRARRARRGASRPARTSVALLPLHARRAGSARATARPSRRALPRPLHERPASAPTARSPRARSPACTSSSPRAPSMSRHAAPVAAARDARADRADRPGAFDNPTGAPIFDGLPPERWRHVPRLRLRLWPRRRAGCSSRRRGRGATSASTCTRG